jgi:hypothetical protein
VLVLKRIHLKLYLKLKPDQRETAERVHGFYKDACPVYRSIGGSVAMTTELIMEDIP